MRSKLYCGLFCESIHPIPVWCSRFSHRF